MDRNQLKEKFYEILKDSLGVEKQNIKENSDLVQDLGADSLDVIEILMKCESAFDITIPDADVENFTLVKDLVDYGMKRLNKE